MDHRDDADLVLVAGRLHDVLVAVGAQRVEQADSQGLLPLKEILVAACILVEGSPEIVVVPLHRVAVGAVIAVDLLDDHWEVLVDALAERQVRHLKVLQGLLRADGPRVRVGDHGRRLVVDVLIVGVQLSVRHIVGIAPALGHHRGTRRRQILNSGLARHRSRCLGRNGPDLVPEDLDHNRVTEGLKDGRRHRRAVLGLILLQEVDGRVLNRVMRPIGLGNCRKPRLEGLEVENTVNVRKTNGRHLERRKEGRRKKEEKVYVV